MNPRIGIILVVSVCWFAASAAGDNIVVNGSFEETTYTGPNGDLVPTGWTLLPPNNVSQSDFDIESSVNSATFQGPEDGVNYAAFMSSATDGGQDCLFETLNTTAGQQYTVSFWVAITAASLANTNTVLIPQWQWNQPGQTDMPNSFYATPNGTGYSAPTNTGPVNYEEFTFTETASTDLVNLMFHGTDANGAILLDNVVVTQVSPLPEPASQWLISLGFVIVGGTALRRNRAVSAQYRLSARNFASL